MINLDELMRLRDAASSGKWKISLVPDPEFPGVQIYRLYTGRRFSGQLETHFPGDPEAHYIVAACNAVPLLVARIRELEEQLSAQSLKQVSALEPCRIVSNNNSTPPEWLMRRFTEVK